MSDNKCIRKTRRREVTLERKSNARKNCDTGFRSGRWQTHHICCKHSIASRNTDDYIEDCLWITQWDINEAHNLIGLPTNKQYRESKGMIPENLPSHQVDHNTRYGYTKECTLWLQRNVWEALDRNQKNHEVTAERIRASLREASEHFREELESRGGRCRGTKYCWERRFPDHPEYVEHWYYAFSMAENPSKRHPGIDMNRLTEIFKKI